MFFEQISTKKESKKRPPDHPPEPPSETVTSPPPGQPAALTDGPGGVSESDTQLSRVMRERLQEHFGIVRDDAPIPGNLPNSEGQTPIPPELSHMAQQPLGMAHEARTQSVPPTSDDSESEHAEDRASASHAVLAEPEAPVPQLETGVGEEETPRGKLNQKIKSLPERINQGFCPREKKERSSSSYLPAVRSDKATRHHSIPYPVMEGTYQAIDKQLFELSQAASSSSSSSPSDAAASHQDTYQTDFRNLNQSVIQTYLKEWMTHEQENKTFDVQTCQLLKDEYELNQDEENDWKYFQDFVKNVTNYMSFITEKGVEPSAARVQFQLRALEGEEGEEESETEEAARMREEELSDFLTDLFAWLPGNLTVGPTGSVRKKGDPGSRFDITASLFHTSDPLEEILQQEMLSQGVTPSPQGQAPLQSQAPPQDGMLPRTPGGSAPALTPFQTAWQEIWNQLMANPSQPEQTNPEEGEYAELTGFSNACLGMMNFLERSQAEEDPEGEPTRDDLRNQLLHQHIPFLLHQNMAHTDKDHMLSLDRIVAGNRPGKYFAPPVERGQSSGAEQVSKAGGAAAAPKRKPQKEEPPLDLDLDGFFGS